MMDDVGMGDDGTVGDLSELSQVLIAAFEVLQSGAQDRRAAFHTPVFASLGLDGRPLSRIIVLREFDPDQRNLRFHTDWRSHKVRQIRHDPRVSFTFYDPAMKLQLRCEGQARLHHQDAISAKAWEASQRMSKVCYGTAPAPGLVIEQADDFALPDDQESIAAGQEHFCAVVTQVTTLEWLWLGFKGHRRARFIWDDNGNVDGVWLVP